MYSSECLSLLGREFHDWGVSFFFFFIIIFSWGIDEKRVRLLARQIKVKHHLCHCPWAFWLRFSCFFFPHQFTEALGIKSGIYMQNNDFCWDDYDHSIWLLFMGDRHLSFNSNRTVPLGFNTTWGSTDNQNVLPYSLLAF